MELVAPAIGVQLVPRELLEGVLWPDAENGEGSMRGMAVVDGVDGSLVERLGGVSFISNY